MQKHPLYVPLLFRLIIFLNNELNQVIIKFSKFSCIKTFFFNSIIINICPLWIYEGSYKFRRLRLKIDERCLNNLFYFLLFFYANHYVFKKIFSIGKRIWAFIHQHLPFFFFFFLFRGFWKQFYFFFFYFVSDTFNRFSRQCAGNKEKKKKNKGNFFMCFSHCRIEKSEYLYVILKHRNGCYCNTTKIGVFIHSIMIKNFNLLLKSKLKLLFKIIHSIFDLSQFESKIIHLMVYV